MTNKIYVDCAVGIQAETLCNFLDQNGFTYGYPSSGPCQKRAYSNMPYITIDLESRLYCGSKGKSLSDDWTRFTELTLSSVLHSSPPLDVGLLNDLLSDMEKALEDRQRWIENRLDQARRIKGLRAKVKQSTTNTQLREHYEAFQRIV